MKKRALLTARPRPAKGARHEAAVTGHVAASAKFGGAALAHRPHFLAARSRSPGCRSAAPLQPIISADDNRGSLGARADVDDNALASTIRMRSERARTQRRRSTISVSKRHRFSRTSAAYAKARPVRRSRTAGPGRPAQRLATPEAVDRRRHRCERPGQERASRWPADGAIMTTRTAATVELRTVGNVRGEIRVRPPPERRIPGVPASHAPAGHAKSHRRAPATPATPRCHEPAFRPASEKSSAGATARRVWKPNSETEIFSPLPGWTR